MVTLTLILQVVFISHEIIISQQQMQFYILVILRSTEF